MKNAKIKKIFCVLVLLLSLTSCSPQQKKNEDVNIGVSIGVGSASRWETEKVYMEERAKELGVNIEVRLNKAGSSLLTQTEDCIELIDSGIDVLILTPRDVTQVDEILAYAKSKNVPVISYARIVLDKYVDLFVGYDSTRIGQMMGQYLSELVYEGDYIILRGDDNDNNAKLLYTGAMRYIDPIRPNINVILEASVPGWLADEAKKMVSEAIANNGGNVDAILAPNDKIAGACAEAVAEAGIDHKVIITGMDAEIDAARRIVKGTQDMTVYMDLHTLANTAVEQAVNFAKGDKLEVNDEFDNNYSTPIQSNLISGQIVTQKNIDKILIDSGYFTADEIYGEQID